MGAVGKRFSWSRCTACRSRHFLEHGKVWRKSNKYSNGYGNSCSGDEDSCLCLQRLWRDEMGRNRERSYQCWHTACRSRSIYQSYRECETCDFFRSCFDRDCSGDEDICFGNVGFRSVFMGADWEGFNGHGRCFSGSCHCYKTDAEEYGRYWNWAGYRWSSA